MRIALALALYVVTQIAVHSQIPVVQRQIDSPSETADDKAALELKKFAFVHLRVDCADAGVRGATKAMIEHDFEKLGMVKFVDDGSQTLTIECKIVPTFNNEHLQVGYALSWTVESNFVYQMVQLDLVLRKVDKQSRLEVAKWLDEKGSLENHLLTACGINGIEDAIGGDVAEIFSLDVLSTVSNQRQLMAP